MIVFAPALCLESPIFMSAGAEEIIECLHERQRKQNLCSVCRYERAERALHSFSDYLTEAFALMYAAEN